MIKSINLISQFNQIKLNWTKTPNRLVSSPRISNFSQILKSIKLIHKTTFILSHNKNPLINFQRKCLNQQKSQNFIGSKFSHNAWKICMKHENKWKRRRRRQKPCKMFEGKWQKIDWKPWPIEEREKSGFEKVWKW